MVASAIRAELRYTDVCARYGGDEFIVLLPETPLKGALEVAERIRGAVAGTPLESAGGAAVVSSVSIGVAAFPEHGRTLDALAGRADRALYQAKQTRNRVEHYRPA
jgi:diguanylate cyclase (GGDEF)-like protein